MLLSLVQKFVKIQFNILNYNTFPLKCQLNYVKTSGNFVIDWKFA